MYDKNQAHYIAVTGILVKDSKFLIVKRAEWEKAFPGRWTVPGGKLEVLDYTLREKDTAHHWYNVFEDVLKREIKEEVGLEIKNIGYVTSMVYIRPDKIPCIIVSLHAEPLDEQIKLCNALTEYAWIDLNEAKDYDLIDGILDELIILEHFLKNGERMVWKKFKDN
ncbi:MAG: NUDIX domain-containing protein [Nanoarchaeota archaeon]